MGWDSEWYSRTVDCIGTYLIYTLREATCLTSLCKSGSPPLAKTKNYLEVLPSSGAPLMAWKIWKTRARLARASCPFIQAISSGPRRAIPVNAFVFDCAAVTRTAHLSKCCLPRGICQRLIAHPPTPDTCTSYRLSPKKNRLIFSSSPCIHFLSL